MATNVLETRAKMGQPVPVLSKDLIALVNAKFASLFTTPCCGMQMWYLPSLPHLYLTTVT